MHDNCNPDNCPVNARVEMLEERFGRFENDAKAFHEKLDDRVKAQETLTAVQNQKMDEANTKLDKILSWREEQDNKPNKLIDHLKENAINYIMLAILCLMLAKMGLGG